MTERWHPLLTGEPADRAWQAIRAIAEDLGTPSSSELFSPNAADPDQWSLAGGTAGAALFFAYLAEATGDEVAEERGVDFLEATLETAAGQPPGILSLWQGLLGVSWCYDHLEGRLFEAEDDSEDAEEESSDADALLAHYLTHAGANEVYDLIQGLAGFGVACLEGLPRPGARRGLDLVLDRLLSSYESLDHGIGWFTPPEFLPEWQRELAPDGYYNLGVAHGMPAVVTLLAGCLGAGIRVAELMPVLDGLVEWILAQRGPQGFPSWVPKGRPAQKAARLAWCYGDPGVTAALMAAGRAVGKQSWQDAAADVACRAAARGMDPELAGVRDAGICHGAAGVAHIFNRLYQTTGSPELARAARHWFGETLAMRRPDRGVGGYQAWTVPRGAMGSGELGWVDEPGLLTGAAGVGLCLLAAVSDREPAWDASLLISVPDAELGAAMAA